MRLITRPIGVPYEAVHRDHIMIPGVVSRHLSIAKLAYPAEVGVAVKPEIPKISYDLDDDASVNGFFNELKHLISNNNMRALCRDDVISGLHLLVLEGDPPLILRTTSVIMRILTIDGKGTFSRKLMKGEGFMKVISPLFHSITGEMRSDPPKKILGLEEMILSNVLCMLGHVIPHHNVKTLITPPLLERVMDLTNHEHEVVRGNSYFCIRMMVEKDPDMLKQIPNCLGTIMRSIFDTQVNVGIEGLRAFCFLIEKGLIEDESVYMERGPLFEQISRSDNMEAAMVAEQILYEIERRTDGYMRG